MICASALTPGAFQRICAGKCPTRLGHGPRHETGTSFPHNEKDLRGRTALHPDHLDLRATFLHTVGLSHLRPETLQFPLLSLCLRYPIGHNPQPGHDQPTPFMARGWILVVSPPKPDIHTPVQPPRPLRVLKSGPWPRARARTHRLLLSVCRLQSEVIKQWSSPPRTVIAAAGVEGAKDSSVEAARSQGGGTSLLH